jgi:hypothetical protein
MGYSLIVGLIRHMDLCLRYEAYICLPEHCPLRHGQPRSSLPYMPELFFFYVFSCSNISPPDIWRNHPSCLSYVPSCLAVGVEPWRCPAHFQRSWLSFQSAPLPEGGIEECGITVCS